MVSTHCRDYSFLIWDLIEPVIRLKFCEKATIWSPANANCRNASKLDFDLLAEDRTKTNGNWNFALKLIKL